MRNLKLCKNWHLILINILLMLIFIIFYGHFGNIIVDSFREAYIPSQIIKGEVLYKDIFLIYAPFSYLINALLFVIFGVKLKVLYIAGLIASCGILNLTFLVAKKFMPKIYALVIVLFIISVSVLSPNVFNFIFPYSYGVLYGVFFALASIYSALNKKDFLAYLFYTCAVLCKYEFVFLILSIILFLGFRSVIKNISGILIPLIIAFIPLFIGGLNIEDLLLAVGMLFSIGSTQTLRWFYEISGLVFSIQLIPVYFVEFAKVFIPMTITVVFKYRYLYLLLFVYMLFVANPAIYLYAFLLILIIYVFRYRKISKEKAFVIYSCILVSLKLFFSLTFQSYGIFFVPFGLLALFLLVDKEFKKALIVIIIASTLNFGFNNIKSLMNSNFKIDTKKGVLYTIQYYGKSINELVDYINKNTIESDKVVVYPECLSVNFLTGRDSDSNMYSLLPLYVESFGEDYIINRLKLIKPEYIIISNYDTSDYYYSSFGKDYAINVFDYIKQNYKLVKTIENDFVFNIYKMQ